MSDRAAAENEATRNDNNNNNSNDGKKPKIRLLIITQGGARQETLTRLLLSDNDNFLPPLFSPGVPSRALRSRRSFFDWAHRVHLIPAEEWDCWIAAGMPEQGVLSDCLQHVTIDPRRRRVGAQQQQLEQQQKMLPYMDELWRKAKTLNRNRAVLACLFAHLLAMETFVGEETECCCDLIVEDNIRWSPAHSASRIRKAAAASLSWQEQSGKTCHVRYMGWLGSRINLEWVFDRHFLTNQLSSMHDPTMIARWPTTQDIEQDIGCCSRTESTSIDRPTREEKHQRPGGTPVWGLYAYWISPTAYQTVLDTLRLDVGAMLWKSKRMRYYQVKPIDKIVPRIIFDTFGVDAVHLASQPAFFRAPMLSSAIHRQWDDGFCNSTDYQLGRLGSTWSDLLLTCEERETVQRFQETGVWEASAHDDDDDDDAVDDSKSR